MMKVKKRDSHYADNLILLAEDEEALREVTKEILENLGYGVITACDGAMAVKQFMQYRDK
ncbi:response regulator, partial [Mariprofundus sp. EBB-1]